MTATGYGDIVPQTILGKMVATVAMVAGSLFLSIPLAIVGNEFQAAWNEASVLLSAAIRSHFERLISLLVLLFVLVLVFP